MTALPPIHALDDDAVDRLAVSGSTMSTRMTARREQERRAMRRLMAAAVEAIDHHAERVMYQDDDPEARTMGALAAAVADPRLNGYTRR